MKLKSNSITSHLTTCELDRNLQRDREQLLSLTRAGTGGWDGGKFLCRGWTGLGGDGTGCLRD